VTNSNSIFPLIPYILLPKHLSMKKFILISLAMWSSLLAIGQTNVQWVNMVNTRVDGNSLIKTGSNGWNGGASSSQQLAAATDGYAEILVNQEDTHRFFGLSANDASVHFTDIDFALFLLSNQSIRIYELGSYKGSYGEYKRGDKMKIERVGRQVKYLKNGIVLYTSTNTSNSSLVVDATIYHQGGAVENATVSFGDNTTACTDADNDGVCQADDCDDNNGQIPAAPGTACNDNNPNTEDDVILADGCTCRGIIPSCTDADNDGVCQADDCDDSNANIPTTPNSLCNDNNSTTENDRIQSDGCTCAGTPIQTNDGNETNSGLWTQGTNKIYQEGKVLIGPANTTVPGAYNLYVTQGILSERVRVTPTTGNWADYVFEEDYPLNSLQFVERHVKTNKHLPNVPAAATVEKEGIDLGNMDATLLRQIEELWLHTIELNKKVDSLQEEIKRLKNKE